MYACMSVRRSVVCMCVLCVVLQDAVVSLSNEIRWVDEEGLKARLDAEAELRTRIAAVLSRVDELEDALEAVALSAVAPTVPIYGASGKGELCYNG